MAEFKYIGKNIENKTVKGKINAKNKIDVFDALKAKGIYSYQIDEVIVGENISMKLKANELADFSRQIGSMLNAGVTITRTISILMDQANSQKLKNLYKKLYGIINQGNTLSYAMDECKSTFPTLMINMYKAGETSGRLDKSAIKMAEFYEKEYKLNTKIEGAMAYPIILFVLTIAVTILIFTFVIPRFVDLFVNMQLPLLTRLVIAISNALTNYWYIFITIVAVITIGIIFLKKIIKVATKIDEIRLIIPKIGRLLSIIYTARFSRTLSSLYTSGITMVDAVSISAKIIGNRFVSAQFMDVVSKIKDGNALSFSIKEVVGIDKKLISAIYIGEETGKLDEMLLSMANNYDYEAEMATAKLLTFIEPVMIIIMALIVGTIMFAVMLPIITLYTNI